MSQIDKREAGLVSTNLRLHDHDFKGFITRKYSILDLLNVRWLIRTYHTLGKIVTIFLKWKVQT